MGDTAKPNGGCAGWSMWMGDAADRAMELVLPRLFTWTNFQLGLLLAGLHCFCAFHAIPELTFIQTYAGWGAAALLAPYGIVFGGFLGYVLFGWVGVWGWFPKN